MGSTPRRRGGGPSGKHTDKKVGIDILNYRNYVDTLECLGALRNITYPNAEVVVVDNDSQNGSLEHIGRRPADRGVRHLVIAEDTIEGCGRIARRRSSQKPARSAAARRATTLASVGRWRDRPT